MDLESKIIEIISEAVLIGPLNKIKDRIKIAADRIIKLLEVENGS